MSAVCVFFALFSFRFTCRASASVGLVVLARKIKRNKVEYIHRHGNQPDLCCGSEHDEEVVGGGRGGRREGGREDESEEKMNPWAKLSFCCCCTALGKCEGAREPRAGLNVITVFISLDHHPYRAVPGGEGGKGDLKYWWRWW